MEFFAKASSLSRSLKNETEINKEKRNLITYFSWKLYIVFIKKKEKRNNLIHIVLYTNLSLH